MKIGTRFGKLTIVRQVKRNPQWVAECDCGNSVQWAATTIERKRQCGCDPPPLTVPDDKSITQRLKRLKRSSEKSGYAPPEDNPTRAKRLLETLKCRLCGGTDRPLAIDHCHSTGVIRGALCDKCNHLLGLAEERSVSLLWAWVYQWLGAFRGFTLRASGILTRRK